MSPGIAVAVLPEEYYRKPRGVQFKKSYRMRENAIQFAEQHSCRVVIACEDEDRYDVLFDPAGVPRHGVNFELVVDRGEFIAVPELRAPSRVLPQTFTPPAPEPRRTSRKTVWNFLQSWLAA
jgi:hypothetical protein